MSTAHLSHPSITFGIRRLRAASLKTVFSHRLSAWARGTWAAMEEMGRLRAAAELRREAARVQAVDPALAASLRALVDPVSARRA